MSSSGSLLIIDFLHSDLGSISIRIHLISESVHLLNLIVVSDVSVRSYLRSMLDVDRL